MLTTLSVRAGIPAAVCLAFVAGSAAGGISRTIDFNTDANGAALNAGEGFVGLEYDAFGVFVSGESRHGSPLNLFDSSFGDVPKHTPGWKGTGGDRDLLTGSRFGTPNLGNVLIFQELRNNPLSNPDDDASGGIFTFLFRDPAESLSVTLVDIDEHRDVGFSAVLGDGSEVDLTPSLVSLANPNRRGNNSVRTYEFSDLGQQVLSFSVDMSGFSGAIGELSFVAVPLVPGPATAGLGVVAAIGVRRPRRRPLGR